MDLGHVHVLPSCALLLVLMTSSRCVAQNSIIEGPVSDGGRECCASQLIDSSGERVVVETSRVIDDGTYRAVRVRLCTTERLSIQLWRRVDSVTYRWHWQIDLSPTTSHTSRSYVIVPLTSPVNITFSDRMAVYTSTAGQLSIPFQTDHTASLYYSTDVFDNVSFNESRTITVAQLRWPRSFRKHIVFCQTADCSDLPNGTKRNGNHMNPAHCCQSERVSCEPGDGVTKNLNLHQKYLDVMSDTMRQLNDVLTAIVSQNYVTGLCPQGFLSGSYGVGSCYLMFTNPVPMAQAVMACRGYGALLLTVETSIEQQFIKNFVQNNTVPGDSNVIQFWTTGMYDPEVQQWFWYAGAANQLPSRVSSKRIAYSHWRNGTVPTPSSVNDVCLTIAVDRQRNVDYWTNELCYRKLATICEIPKRCL